MKNARFLTSAKFRDFSLCTPLTTSTLSHRRHPYLASFVFIMPELFPSAFVCILRVECVCKCWVFGGSPPPRVSRHTLALSLDRF